jgi:outer membrane protein OmpA-like peptidoglycan-associated protein
VELFGSVRTVTRIDRDLRPIFSSDPTVGGLAPAYPLVSQGWSGNVMGDTLVGAKLNLLSQGDRRAAAVALRGSVLLPTGDSARGASSGMATGYVDLLTSTNTASGVELAGFAGLALRPDTLSTTQSNGLRYGVGAAYPSTRPLRLSAEVTGEVPFGKTVTAFAPFTATDGSLVPATTKIRPSTTGTLGATWQSSRGVFIGAGATINLPTADRTAYRTDDRRKGDFVDYLVRIGYHGGVRRYVAPPPPPAPAPPPPPAPQNHAPTVTARCEPCSVLTDGTVRLSAAGQDADGDAVTYRWRVTGGTLQNPSEATTTLTAPSQAGSVQATVTVDDGKGATATATVTIQVTNPPPPPVVELAIEDVYFDFDKSTLRPDALTLLDDAVKKLQANPGKSMIIEGHTCNIGSAEYNLALGARRAKSVQDYLVSRGVASNRLEVRSYGEERPKYSNDTEATRRLNRRAALIVSVQ